MLRIKMIRKWTIFDEISSFHYYCYYCFGGRKNGNANRERTIPAKSIVAYIIDTFSYSDIFYSQLR